MISSLAALIDNEGINFISTFELPPMWATELCSSLIPAFRHMIIIFPLISGSHYSPLISIPLPPHARILFLQIDGVHIVAVFSPITRIPLPWALSIMLSITRDLLFRISIPPSFKANSLPKILASTSRFVVMPTHMQYLILLLAITGLEARP